MESRFKSNNFIAILIAVILIAIGFALAFIHRQSVPKENQTKKPVATITINVSEKDASST
jgi:cell division protein FtsN